jgi:hypothetical protein
MKCNFVRIFTALIFGIIAFTFSPLADSFNYNESAFHARLFQILFFLFIISPPLIVVLLYLIWQELKARNEMK